MESGNSFKIITKNLHVFNAANGNLFEIRSENILSDFLIPFN